MSGNPSPRVALITGGSGGIGAAIVRRLARDGFALAINYAGNANSAQTLVAEVAAAGGRATALAADVSNPAAVRGLYDATESTFGSVDVVVNTAGIMPLSRIDETDDATFDRIVAINFKGTFNSLREGAKRVRAGGRIINFSSSVVGLLMPTYGVYTATKAAVEALTPILARELRGKNITVNAIAPGPTATDLFLKGKPQEAIDRFSKGPPLERLGTPEDIANVVAFLAGPDGGWVNGQTLRANGGLI